MNRQIITKYMLLLAFMFSVPLQAQSLDWPTFRHDPGRTGRAEGSGAITSPTVHWSYNAGGVLDNEQTWMGDADGNGVKELAIIEAGRVSLRTASDQVIWHTNHIGATHIIGSFDLDNDGIKELLVTGYGPTASLIVLNLSDGETIWMYDSFQEGSVGLSASKVTVADIDGDTYLEIVASPFDHDEINAFTFKVGFKSNAAENLLWTYSLKVYSGDNYAVAGNFDADSEIEIAGLENHRLTVLRGADGVPKAEIDNVLFSMNYGLLQAANVDLDSHSEIVAIGSSRHNHAVTVFDVVDNAVSWQYQWHPADGKELVFTENSVADLNNDGTLEIIVSIFNDIDDEYTTTASSPADHDGINIPDRWTLVVFNGVTGEVAAILEDAYLRGVETLNQGTNPYVIVQRVPAGNTVVPHFGTIEAYHFAEGFLDLSWRFTDTKVSLMRPPYRAAQSISKRSRIAAYDINSDGNKEIFLTRDIDQDGDGDRFEAYTASQQGIDIVAATEIDDWESTRVVAFGDHLSGPDATKETALFRSSGVLEVLGPKLDFRASLRVGGFYASPIAVDLEGDGTMEVIAASSTGELSVLNVQDSNIETPPVDKWRFQGVEDPILSAMDLDGDGLIELAVRDMTDPGNPRVALLGDNGNELWEKVFSNYGAEPQQIVYGRFNNDGVFDVLVLIADKTQSSKTDLRLVALDGIDGQEIWNVPTKRNHYIAAQIQPVELTEDDITDVVFTDTYTIEYFDGADGSLITSVPYKSWNTASVVADFDLDGASELLMSTMPLDNGIQLYDLLETDPIWSIPNTYLREATGRYPALFNHADGLGLIKTTEQGSWQAFGPDGVPMAEPQYLRQGELQSDAPNDKNEIRSVTVCDIDGNGTQEVLLGTADGYLMAVSIADGTLVWSLPLRSQVLEPIVADVDNDSQLEILVATGDGYLHMIDQQSLSPPQEVRDVALSYDLVLQNPQNDIDVTERREALGASWDPVIGAAGYRYTVLDVDNIEMIPWKDAGTSTMVVAPTAPLQLGETYRFVVQAYGQSNSISFEVMSDGVEIVDQSPPWISDLLVKPILVTSASDEVAISAKAFDQTWLDRYRVEIVSSNTEVVWSTEAPLFSNEADILVFWDGTNLLGEQVVNGDYQARLTIYDLADHEASASKMVTISIGTGDEPGDIGCGCDWGSQRDGFFSWLFKIFF